MDQTLLIRAIEAILFVATDPIPLKKLEEVFAPDEVERADIRQALDALRRDYMGRGVELTEVGGGLQMRSARSRQSSPRIHAADCPRSLRGAS